MGNSVLGNDKHQKLSSDIYRQAMECAYHQSHTQACTHICRVKGSAKETHPDTETRASETHFGPETRVEETHSAPDQLSTKPTNP